MNNDTDLKCIALLLWSLQNTFTRDSKHEENKAQMDLKAFFFQVLLNTQSAAIQTTFTSSHCIYYTRNTSHYRRDAPVMLGPVSE